MNRREFHRVFAAGVLGNFRFSAQNSQKYQINAGRLRANLEELGRIGRDAAGGITRLAWTKPDIEARRFVGEKLMPAAGLSVRVDPVGNVYGRREGAGGSLPAILFGSHIDSVPNGGMFDGDLGTLAAIEVMHSLQDANLRTRHPLECVAWTNEEGARYGHALFGSRAAVGEVDSQELELKDENGIILRDAVRGAGGDVSRIAESRRKSGEIAAYLELHIEQGGVLEKNGFPIGVVEGIVAIRHYQVAIRGIANHAGTTPMAERRDALIAAARIVLAVQEETVRLPGRQVGTVGKLTVSPNAINVVPGSVELYIELRDLALQKIDEIFQRIQARAREIEAQTGTRIEIVPTSMDQPAVTAQWIRETIASEAAKLGLKTLSLPSGAGHDAQIMAKIAPMGMIFVPSVGGISHSPKELTRWEDVASGCEVLYRTILAMDSRIRP